MTALPSRLYAIVDPLDTGRDPLDLARAMLAGGARLLQLRLKATETGALLAGTIVDANGGDARFGVWRLADATAHWLTSGNSDGAPAWFSADGDVVAARLFALHTHASNYHAFNVWAAASGDRLRLFGADVRALAASADGGRLATREGWGLALWCR